MAGDNPLVPAPAPLKGKQPPANTAVVPVAVVYNVYLFDGTGIKKNSGMTPAIQTTITGIIQGFFDQIIAKRKTMKGTQFSSANVQWISSTPPYPTIAPYELLVYLLPNFRTLVLNRRIEKIPPPSELGRTSLNADGMNGSEAYLTSNDPTLTADIMFHEMMHNKQHMGDSMHVQGGIAAASITSGDQPTASNIQVMAAALANNQPQWAAGIPILVAEATYIANNPNDPLTDD